ncbi:WhiB family transcriptional regulator [Streptomyces sp. N35]|uniref:WhiB family transcriptional regulator n=1 Tax=Streptomyces sp. N35 TaxID=2795730 RepID=UPI0018F5ADBA
MNTPKARATCVGGSGEDWRAGAVCASCDPDLWFPVESATSASMAAEARRLCGTCPVARACLIEAMTAEGSSGAASRYGIRAGLTGEQRYAQFRRQRRDARIARQPEAAAGN